MFSAEVNYSYTTLYPTITIRNHHERRLFRGHLWAFSNELLEIPKDIEPGTVVQLVREFDKKPFALAFYHPNSLISARIISRDPEAAIDPDFFRDAIKRSAARRDFLLKERNAVRLVHGESDGLPGLLVEKYNDIITFQITSAGFEARKPELVEILKELYSPKSIIEKNISHLRKLEGLEEREGLVFGEETDTEIHDGAGTRYQVSLLKGQKTGFYLDQMENRTSLCRYMPQGGTVLDLFSNEGGFALNLARAGAASVLAVDSSQDALDAVRKNAALNNIEEKVQTFKGDCFQFAGECREKYDIVVLDPPSLVRTKKEIKSAERGYLALHKHAMNLVKSEGIMATASCSHHISRDMFIDLIRRAAYEAHRTATILEERGAAADHPIMAMMPETEYLRYFVLRLG